MLNPQMFKAKHLAVVGLKGTGKTNFVKWLVSKYPKHLIFDVLHEYKGFNQYLPTNRQRDEALYNEFDLATKKLVLNNLKKLDLYAIDEANRIVPNRMTMPKTALDIIDFNRHYGLTLVFIARRIAQLHTDATELANYLILFKQTGVNDLKRLDETQEGLSDMMRSKISINDHNFILYDGENCSIEKVPNMD